MASKAKRSPRAAFWVVGLILLAGASVGWRAFPKSLRRRPSYLGLPRAEAVLADLRSSVVVAGSIDTAQKTIVECELETYSSQSGQAQTGGTSTIIELVDDGAMVKEGQMLARIDSSAYVELVRQHEIRLLQARADQQKALLDLKTAEFALQEYRDGQLPQLRQFHQGQILLYETDVQRAKDRLEWVDRMVINGYVSAGQALTDRATLERAEVNLVKARGELSTLDRYSSSLQILKLELAVEAGQREVDYQTLRLERSESRHRKYQTQVEACTIRAPHAGMVIYATSYNPEARIEAGAIAYNRMNLFYLPNLSQTEVHVEIHESMIQRVRVGQMARVRVDGLSDRVLEGHVKWVDQLAMEPKRWWLSPEIRNFSAVIAVHSEQKGVHPGMNAEVEIQCAPRASALIVPSSAVAISGGREVVYVVGRNGLERRAVEAEAGDARHAEIRSGLAEGEEVILDPSGLDQADVLAAGGAAAEPPDAEWPTPREIEQPGVLGCDDPEQGE